MGCRNKLLKVLKSTVCLLGRGRAAERDYRYEGLLRNEEEIELSGFGLRELAGYLSRG
jgi:hypothetical protein